MQLKYTKKLMPAARTLRCNMTSEERHLWYDFLKVYPIPFARQKVLGQYVVDFYCAQAKLVVEVDEAQHYEPKGMEEDACRTSYLKDNFGLDVIRIPNNQVNRNFLGVCEYIDVEVKKRLVKR